MPASNNNISIKLLLLSVIDSRCSPITRLPRLL
uniref:Uncharacterized protein n=1 Tax=Anguilla anguilla TaxID=7936 RepID=A0A0E9RUF7_ANGAN